MKITVPLPINITGENTGLYEPYRFYEVNRQQVKKLKNVFVGNSGFCLNGKGLIKECHHKHPHQYGDYQSEAAHYYYDVSDHPENLVTLDDDNTYLVIHHPWYNYYHWVCESLFRLWMVRHQLDKLILVLPARYKHADFIMGSLEPFQIKNIYFIPDGKSILVKNLCLPQIKPVCDSYNARHLKQVSSFYRNYASSKPEIQAGKIEKLYVSRHFANRRKVINEADILPVLEKHGFIIFYPEHFSFLQQVAIFANVKYLVGEHGSGITNLLFMQKGTSVLELHKSKINDFDHPSPLFWYMAHALDINYYHQVCQTSGREDYFEGDYIIDADLLERNLTLMLNKI
ncbi:glycosyltransferase family 61 protein [Mucilaginibacter ginsenosidivorans]|uniref:Glycosyltransferase family 61 protein n=1 Tax=Mucilaginibacter ginsenosidivorans TaxID=398053 RepID=A0A5B8UTF5_9SPHI|nr:glycosyltransferase family 61 protein [Mucilaginibacter ginsenosidivorans]QEC61671.1 glycosyltransferase family 61 protein [Mucilaginibacter ginsenosidivorans]